MVLIISRSYTKPACRRQGIMKLHEEKKILPSWIFV